MNLILIDSTENATYMLPKQTSHLIKSARTNITLSKDSLCEILLDLPLEKSKAGELGGVFRGH